VADYRATPDGPPWYQLIEGELVRDPSPSTNHQAISLAIALLLAGYARVRRSGRVYIAPLDVYLSDTNVFQPDVFFVSKERAAIMADDGIHGPPDLVVEILSPSSIRRDRVQKLRVYRAAGVKEFWLIDPVSKSIQIYSFGRDPVMPRHIVTAKESFTSPLFPGLTITAAEIFER
jgi:Uma2 family endonuclease